MIFLSASIPDPKRDKKYYQTTDIVAIRDAIRAVATVVIPKSKLVWGGHPSITPMIRYLLNILEIDIQSHITLYQSNYFKSQFPEDNKAIEKIIYTDDKGGKAESLFELRKKMICDNKFSAGIFIGGMEGVETEFDLFREFHPKAKLFPLASTGGASKVIYDKNKEFFSTQEYLINELAYMSLCKKIILK